MATTTGIKTTIRNAGTMPLGKPFAATPNSSQMRNLLKKI